jgi:hypothetical protein
VVRGPGLTVRISDVDYSSDVRSSPWGRQAPSRNHHVWLDLLALDGRMIQGGFGSGQSADEAMLRARDRYHVEQGDWLPLVGKIATPDIPRRPRPMRTAAVPGGFTGPRLHQWPPITAG